MTSDITTYGIVALALVSLAIPAASADTLASRLSDDVVPKGYQVRLSLDPTSSSFRGAVTIEIDIRRGGSTIWLHAVDLNITRASVSVDGATVPAVAGPGAPGLVGLTVDRPLRPGPARLHIDYDGRLSDAPGALFRVSDASGAYIHSLFEPAAARRAIPCFDEPSRLATWQLEVETPAGNVVLSNTPERSRSRTPAGWERVTFEPTPPMPPYLLAVAVGPLESVAARPAGSRRVPVRLWAARGRIARAAHAQGVAPDVVEKLEAYLSLPYPYEKLDLVAAPIGVAGAESPGLIRFREELMLAPAEDTEARQRAFISSCAHEIAHMWFGGLAPISWWRDVWFKEAFASWIGQKIVRAWQPPLTSALGDALFRVNALLKDMQPSAKALQADVSAETDVRALYGSLPYEKGPLVVRAIETFVGESSFRDVVRAFLSSNAGRPAGLAELETVLRSSKHPRGAEAAAMLRQYAVEPGAPLVSMKLRCPGMGSGAGADAGTTSSAGGGTGARLDLSVTRLSVGHAAKTPGEWSVPFCVSYGDRERSWRRCTVLTRAEQELELSEATTCPTWVVPNETADGYYVTDHEVGIMRGLGERIRFPPVSPTALTVLLTDRQTLVPDGIGSLAGALDLVQTFSAHDDPNVILATVELTRRVGGFVPDNLRGELQSFVRRQFAIKAESALAQHVDGDPGQAVVRCSSCDTTSLAPALMAFLADEGEHRPVAAIAQRLADTWLQDAASVPVDLAPIALRVAARFGDAQTYARLAAAFDRASKPQRDWLLDALASSQDPATLSTTLARPDLSGPELLRVFQVSARYPASRAIAFRYLTDHYDPVVRRLPSGADTRLAGMFASSCQIELKADMESLFTPKLSEDGRNRLKRMLAEMTQCSSLRQRHEASARESLLEKK